MPEHAAEQRLGAFTKTGFDPARKVDLAIERGQQLDCLDAAVVFGKAAPVAHELVGEVLKGMAQFFQTASGVRRNLAPYM